MEHMMSHYVPDLVHIEIVVHGGTILDSEVTVCRKIQQKYMLILLLEVFFGTINKQIYKKHSHYAVLNFFVPLYTTFPYKFFGKSLKPCCGDQDWCSFHSSGLPSLESKTAVH